MDNLRKENMELRKMRKLCSDSLNEINHKRYLLKEALLEISNTEHRSYTAVGEDYGVSAGAQFNEGAHRFCVDVARKALMGKDG